PPHPSRSSSFLLILPPPPRSTLFPYTTLFRSRRTRRHSASADSRTAARASRRLLSRAMPKVPQSKAPARQRPALATRSRAICTRSEEHTSELQSLRHLVCRLLLEKKKKKEKKK